MSFYLAAIFIITMSIVTGLANAISVRAYELSVECDLTQPLLPKDYRRGFMSLIKYTLSQYEPELYEELYNSKSTNGNPYKQMTFSVFFPLIKKESIDDYLYTGTKAKLFIRSSDLRIITGMYNGFLKMMKKQQRFNLFDNELVVSSVRGNLNIPQITCQKVIFETLSPLVISIKEKDKELFITPEHPAFRSALEYYIRVSAREVAGIEDFSINVDYIFKRKVVKHYNVWMTCLSGLLLIEAPVPVLSAVYANGLGAKRAQGFGMLKIHKEIK